MQIAPSLSMELLTAADGVGGVVLDASGITFADSAVLHALVETHERTDLRIAAVPAHLRRVLSVTGLETVFHLYPTLEAALADTRS
ncbi:STAS domain-containing protein [Streptomyces sp. PLK6-54]|uniref:STAS domain-containing protein n=2 Tax=Actinacidiphila acidipaludis TaxID=2873382 RepID=A0ABS7QAT6_9ACTN|nr:STAS domain-containing protein [Streptomyces acidipaludis]